LPEGYEAVARFEPGREVRLTVAGAVARYEGEGFSVRFDYGWPMWVTLGLALAAIVVSLRFGGRVDDIQVKRGKRPADESLH
jgi:hypothetical protein